MRTSSNNRLGALRTRRSSFAAAMLCGFLLVLPAVPLFADALDLVDEQISSWHLETANGLFSELSDAQRNSPKAKYLHGKLLFFSGRYREALPEFRAAIEGARAEIAWKILRDRAQESESVFSKLAKKRSENGREAFFISH